MINAYVTTLIIISLIVNLTIPLFQTTPQVTVSTYYGGSLEDTIRDVATDADGNIYLTGGTASTNFVATVGDTTPNGSMDAFVVKLSPTGQLLWATLLGGPNYDRPYAIETDDSGIYIGGRAGAAFPTTAGVLQPTFAGDSNPNGLYGTQDGFMAKFTHDGQLVWSTYFGGPDRSFFRDIDIDAAGNVYGALTDVTLNNPHVTTGAFQTQRIGGEAGVIVKVSGDATAVVWATYLDGSGYDTGTPSIRVNDQGEAWVLGFTNSSDMPTTANAFDLSYNGGGDLHLGKLSADGSQLLYGTYFGGDKVEYSETHGLALDAQGNPYITGTTKSSNLPVTAGAFDTSYNGEGASGTGDNTNYDGDGFVANFSAAGQLLASTYLGGGLGDGLEGIAVASNGDIVVSGATYSTNYPTTPGAFQTTRAGAADVIITVLNNQLSALVYSSYVGGSGIDYGRSAMADANAYYAVGHSKSTNFPTVNALQTSRVGADDGVLVKVAVSTPTPTPTPTPVPSPTPSPCTCPTPTPDSR